jgi:hypothetical protein
MMDALEGAQVALAAYPLEKRMPFSASESIWGVIKDPSAAPPLWAEMSLYPISSAKIKIILGRLSCVGISGPSVQVVGILSCTGIKIADNFGIDQISIFILNSQAVMPNMARRPKVIRVFLSIIK